MFKLLMHKPLTALAGILVLWAGPVGAENRIDVRSIDAAGFPLIRLNGVVKNVYLPPVRKGTPMITDVPPEITEVADGETKRAELKSSRLDTALRLVIVIDATKSVPIKQFQASLRTASEVVKNLGPGDEAAVFRINGTPALIQEFTGSKDRLTTAINGLQRTGMQTKIFDALYSAIHSARESKHRTGNAAVLLLTDGRDEGSALTEQDCLTLTTLGGGLDAPVYAVIGPKTVRRERLERVALGSGGQTLDQHVNATAIMGAVRGGIRPRFEILYESKLVEAGRPALAVESTLRWRLSGGDEEARTSYSIPWSGWLRARLVMAGWVGLGLAAFIVLLLLLIAVGVAMLTWKAMTRGSEPTVPEPQAETAKTIKTVEGETAESLLVTEEDILAREESDADGLLNYAASGYALSGRPPEKFVRDYSYALLQTALKDAESYKEAALVIKKDGRIAKQYGLFLESTVIGKGRYAHVRLDDSTASAVHAKIRKVEGKYVLYDMMSGRGISLNNKKLLRPRALSDGDEFTVGHTVFRFEGSV